MILLKYVGSPDNMIEWSLSEISFKMGLDIRGINMIAQLLKSEFFQEVEMQNNFERLYSLRILIGGSLMISDFEPSLLLDDAIHLTEAGEKLVPFLQKKINGITMGEIKLAIFIMFAHRDIFIDINKTNSDELAILLDGEINSGKVMYPWVYGKVLYDKFFDAFLSRPSKLTNEESLLLLEGTPCGVFQVSDLIVGPFGLLKSFGKRWLPPVLSASLWHCTDPSCDSEHSVTLLSGVCNVVQGVSILYTYLYGTSLTPEKWDQFFLNFSLGKNDWYYDDFHLIRFPWLLGNAFSENELRSILEALIEKHSKKIREIVPLNDKYKGLWKGSAKQVVAKLQNDECMQLILIMPDADIVNCLEMLIDRQIITIPSTETRTTKIKNLRGSWLKINCECSRFGVRTVALYENIAPMRLKNLIRELYGEEKEIAQLEWKLRLVTGENIYEKLDTYLLTEDPKQILRNLVLTNSDYLNKAFLFLRFGNFEMPTSPSEEEFLIEKLLWKLGFNMALYPSYQGLFWSRLDKLLDSARTFSTYNEHDRELIRSAAVNFFVSLEEILDFSLSFITWALLSDHYGVTKFNCNFNDARRFMATNLNGVSDVEFDAEGKNTLFPLIQGFTILADLVGQVDIEKRLEKDIPGFHNRTKTQLFPFTSKRLLGDLRQEDLNRIIALLREITAVLSNAMVANVRNRLEHRRPDFPKQEEIETACRAISDIVSKMEISGVCPTIFIFAGKEIDQYGRSFAKFKDYRHKDVIIGEQSQFEMAGLPNFNRPQIIVPWMHLGNSSQYLRFAFEEGSDYVQIWKDYPKRRRLSFQ